MVTMISDLKVLKEAFSLFLTDKDGVFLQGRFQDLFVNLKLWKHIGSKQKRVLSQLFKFVIEDLWNISQIIDRIEWSRLQFIDDESSEYRWMYYASLDVQSIHYEFRSIMDYMAKAIGAIYSIPRKKSESFERLKNWSKKNPNRLDKDIEILLLSADWFGQIRGIRDLFLHLGGSALIFGKPKDGILFQIYKEDFHKVISKDHLLYNENVAYFDKYFALYFSFLLLFLENISVVLANKLGAALRENATRNYGVGFQIAYSWIKNLIVEIESKLSS
jgi:hypothetical protein